MDRSNGGEAQEEYPDELKVSKLNEESLLGCRLLDSSGAHKDLRSGSARG